jgi:uncharacterized protein involved in outer membrane biogenesis
MKRSFKWMLSACVVLAVLLAAIAFMQTRSINLTHFKNQLDHAVMQASGERLNIEGSLNIHLFPTPSITLTNLNLHPTDPKQTAPAFQAQSLRAQLRWWPLLHGTVAVRAIHIQQATLHLSANMALPHAPAPATPKAKNAPTQAPRTTQPPVFMQWPRIDVKELTLNYTDAQQHTTAWTLHYAAFTPTSHGAQLHLKGRMQQHDRMEDFAMALHMQAKGNNMHFSLLQAQWGNVTLSGTLTKQGPTLSSKTLQLQEGTTRIHLPFSYTFGPQSSLRFQVKGSKLDLDELLPQPQKHADASQQAAVQKPAAHPPTPASPATPSTPKDAAHWPTLQGDIQLDALILHGITFNHLRATVRNQGTQLQISPLNTRVFNGTVNAGITFDTATHQAALTLIVKNMQIGALWPALHKASVVTGTTNLQLSLQLPNTKNLQTLQQTASGNMQWNIKNGRLLGQHWMQLINQAAPSAKLPASNTNSTSGMPFNNIQWHATLANGVLTNDVLLLDAPHTHITGKGTVSLLDRNYLYHVQVAQNAQAFPLPLIIQGELKEGSKPSVQPDLMAAGKIALQKHLQQNNGQTQGTQQGHALGNALQQLFQK